MLVYGRLILNPVLSSPFRSQLYLISVCDAAHKYVKSVDAENGIDYQTHTKQLLTEVIPDQERMQSTMSCWHGEE